MVFIYSLQIYRCTQWFNSHIHITLPFENGFSPERRQTNNNKSTNVCFHHNIWFRQSNVTVFHQ